MAIPAVNVDLLLAHPFDRIVINVANLISDKQFLGCNEAAKPLGPTTSRYWLEGDACDSVWLL